MLILKDFEQRVAFYEEYSYKKTLYQNNIGIIQLRTNEAGNRKLVSIPKDKETKEPIEEQTRAFDISLEELNTIRSYLKSKNGEVIDTNSNEYNNIKRLNFYCKWLYNVDILNSIKGIKKGNFRSVDTKEEFAFRYREEELRMILLISREKIESVYLEYCRKTGNNIFVARFKNKFCQFLKRKIAMKNVMNG